MKLAINILTSNRAEIRNGILTQTRIAESYSADVAALRRSAEYALKQAESKAKIASEYCEVRNQLQAQLNDLDKAIALLERKAD